MSLNSLPIEKIKKFEFVFSSFQVFELISDVVDVELDAVDVADTEDGRLQSSGRCLQIADHKVRDFPIRAFESGSHERSRVGVGQRDVAALKKKTLNFQQGPGGTELYLKQAHTCSIAAFGGWISKCS